MLNQKNICQAVSIGSLGMIGAGVFGMGLTPAGGAALALLHFLAEKTASAAKDKFALQPPIKNSILKIATLAAQGTALSFVLHMLKAPLPLFAAYVFTTACNLLGTRLGEKAEDALDWTKTNAAKCMAYFKQTKSS